jgi:hypothetical protein
MAEVDDGHRVCLEPTADSTQADSICGHSVVAPYETDRGLEDDRPGSR